MIFSDNVQDYDEFFSSSRQLLQLCGRDCAADFLTWIMLSKARSDIDKSRVIKILQVYANSNENKAEAFHSAPNKIRHFRTEFISHSE